MHVTHSLGKQGQQQRPRWSERTSISCASYRKSPALGLMRTCTGMLRAARTALMSPALGKTSTDQRASVKASGKVSKHVSGAVCHSRVSCCTTDRHQAERPFTLPAITNTTPPMGAVKIDVVPELGVRPPQDKPEHNSTRAAPAVWAQTADERDSTQISTAIPAFDAGATISYKVRLLRRLRAATHHMCARKARI